ncbi:MAG TPA: hypothetical protein VLZ29_09090 [Sulfurimonas sp.]|uniref:hypothetical protein n=1 Tax=Sulfurimonas sp. TaxID=2022749 RepID=UPI002B8C7350|nr:hypothetical protein [Sulfurimonas sp.]HUH43261.1 hypothetical protein [Sulfurimonas sp.]
MLKNNYISFDYPQNRDKTISNFLLKILLAIFLIYIYSKQDEILGQYIFIFFIFVWLLHIFIEFKTFYKIDKISVEGNYLILQKNEHIRSKTLLSNLAFKVTTNAIDISKKIIIDFYEQSSKKHLIHFKSSEIENDVFEKFIKILSEISNRDNNDFTSTSHNQLISFFQENMNEDTIKGEFIKYQNDVFFSKYNVLVIIGIIITVFVTLHFIRN